MFRWIGELVTRRSRRVLALGLLGVVAAAVVGIGAFGKPADRGVRRPRLRQQPRRGAAGGALRGFDRLRPGRRCRRR
ncbi:hypothetical protein [Nocardioides convexus]|uniref:hypothetical protein n=1 Tax=Nocardioides convexus TaxID=2712224 RepID=UPI002418244A|nr:hypothetical protein [Nocardioides convexus]